MGFNGTSEARKATLITSEDRGHRGLNFNQIYLILNPLKVVFIEVTYNYSGFRAISWPTFRELLLLLNGNPVSCEEYKLDSMVF